MRKLGSPIEIHGRLEAQELSGCALDNPNARHASHKAIAAMLCARRIVKRAAGHVAKRLFGVVIGILSLTFWPAYAEDLAAPPYFINSGNFVVLGVAFDEALAKKVVPPDFRPAAGGTGIIIMYTAEGYGLPAFSSSWLGVEVDGFDTPAGGKARWMLTGLYGPTVVSTALSKFFGYPTREGTTRLERDGNRIVAVGSVNGVPLIRAELRLKAGPCAGGRGMAHEVTRRLEGGGIRLIKIPYVTDWCQAESASVEITAPEGDLFRQLGPLKVLWGGYSTGGFGWSAPEMR